MRAVKFFATLLLFATALLLFGCLAQPPQESPTPSPSPTPSSVPSPTPSAGELDWTGGAAGTEAPPSIPE
ncbi:hypothetical protein HY991_01745 [Candidatus Micrarchaeota archaeon]|nr:hypothetical protein [Candidatus Micrarchaeota archaeon]